MKRRELRQHIFEMLFQVEFHSSEELEEQLALFLQSIREDQEVTAEDEAYILKKCRGILEVLPALDLAVDRASWGWKTSRLGKVELAILRLAVYEMRYDEDVPVSVAINEAVELAKKYGQEDSPAFINGILGKAAKLKEEQEEKPAQPAEEEAVPKPEEESKRREGAAGKKRVYITRHPERSSRREDKDAE